MNSLTNYARIAVCLIFLYLSLCPVSAQGNRYCQNCFYGADFCDPVSFRCIYGCRQGYKGSLCLEQCITKGCKHCEYQRNGIEQCTSCLNSGYYGPLCNLRCSSNCKRIDGKDDICDHFGNCIFGCVAPYIGDKCTEQNCPFDNCIQCALMYNQHVYCHQCLNGYYWIRTVEKCVPCTSNCRYGTPDCDTNTGACLSGLCLDGWVGSKCDIPCDIQHCSACIEMSGKAICVTCDQGFFPDTSTDKTSCIPCNRNCGENCNRQNGQCLSGCKPGFYGGNCDLKCTLPYCEECSYDDPVKEDQVLCTKCSNGFYYDDNAGCQLCPGNCKPGENYTCQFIGGNCLNGCVDGWYGPTCEERCSSNCLKNVCNAIGSCDCKLGWFGHRCDRSCPVRCLHCEDYIDGVCGVCEAGWYGLTCNKKCSSNCKPNDYSSFVYCSKETGYCREGCNPAWYGGNCSLPCSQSCISSSCDRNTGECLVGCAVNKYGTFCDKSCPLHCKSSFSTIYSVCNSTDGRCLYGCEDGYYGSSCNLTCSENCFSDRCDEVSGNCLQGCKSGYTGKKCDQKCTSTCPTACGINCLHDLCDAVTNTCTAGCHQGWYGTRCEKICSDKCLNRECDQNIGNCKVGCVDQHFGPKCESICSQTCEIQKCEQYTGVCDTCKRGYYGPDCRERCPAECDNYTCDKWTGHCFRCGLGRQGDYCSQDCLPGFHGENCESECGHCKDGSPCYIYDGICPSGCDNGYTGQTCTQALSGGERSSNPNKAMQIAIGCAVGGVFCCLVIIAAVCWYKRRQLTKTKKVEEPSVHFRNAQVIIGSSHQPEPSAPRDTTGDQASNQSSASEHSQSDPLLGDPQGSQIRLLDVIRQGHFYSLVKGEVIKHGTTKQCFVKLLKLKEVKDDKHIYRLTLEAEILAQCGSHKNIISLIKTYQNTEIFCVAIDTCVQTGLLHYLRRLPSVSGDNGAMSLDPVNIYKITKFVTEICSAVTHIHDLKIIHRALRAGHIYLARNHVTKLGDFDWAEWFNRDSAADTVSHRFDLPKNYYQWLSPESCINNEFSFKTDVWSLGLIFWEVFSLARKTPYVGLNKEDHKQAIRDGMRPAKPALAHFSLYRLMKNCWRYDPADRPPSQHVLSQLEMIQASTWTTVQQL